ncbi:MAG: 4Fe-4S dicluster domain-containing protein [Clostridiales bacterium]|nr:4Fe-4S dicluster domain-containing protein [Clostridiales bacterium]
MEREELEINMQALKRRESKKPSAASHRIAFQPSYCKACGLCVDTCPSGVLALHDDPGNKWGITIKSERKDYCIGCRMCEMQCPDFAIFID